MKLNEATQMFLMVDYVSVSVVYAATSSSLPSTQRKGDRAEVATDVG